MTPTDKIKNVLTNTLTQPTDYERYILDCINPDATFEQVHNQPHKVYEIINCSESEARVLVFEAISKIYNQPYEVIYDRWLSIL